MCRTNMSRYIFDMGTAWLTQLIQIKRIKKKNFKINSI